MHGFIGLFFFSVKICDSDLYTSFLELGQNEINSGAGVQQIQGNKEEIVEKIQNNWKMYKTDKGI